MWQTKSKHKTSFSKVEVASLDMFHIIHAEIRTMIMHNDTDVIKSNQVGMFFTSKQKLVCTVSTYSLECIK